MVTVQPTPVTIGEVIDPNPNTITITGDVYGDKAKYTWSAFTYTDLQ